MPIPKYKDRAYEVLPYNHSWQKQFEVEASALKDIFGADAVVIEHIGSTSVPEMAGKPTIDILVLVSDISVVDKHLREMKSASYDYLVGYVLPGSVLFRRMKNNILLSNVHVFKKDHPHALEILELRDYLRSNLEEVRAYSDIKKMLFEKYPHDYAAYRKQKDFFMEGLIERMKSEKNNRKI